MATNGTTVKAWTESYNRRDLDGWLHAFSSDAAFADLAQGVTAKGRDELLAYGQGWIAALSDAAYTNVRITDAGDSVTMQFDGAGINDGPFGAFPATGKRVSFPVVNVISFDPAGKITRVEQLYDRMDILMQLGHLPAAGS